MNTDIPVFFIVCKGRSGSTLLQAILNAHPHVQVPPESRLLLYLYQKYAGKTRFREADLRRFYQDLFYEDEFRELWKIDTKKLRQALLSQPETTTFARLIKLVYRHAQILPAQDKTVNLLGIKKPVYALFIPQLLRVFPRAKFIHLIRDPRDVSLSSVKNFPTKSLDFAARKWVLFNRCIETQKQQHPQAFFTVRYEDFVTHPEKLSRKLTQFLGIDYTPALLEERRHQMDLSHIETAQVDRINRIFNQLGKPINTKSIGKWKEELTDEQALLIEHLCDDLMTLYHYKKTFNEHQARLSLKKRLYFHYRMWRLKAYYRTPIWLRTGYRKLRGIEANYPLSKSD